MSGLLKRIRRVLADSNNAVVDDGSYDAAEIDRELIASRLQQDVVSIAPLLD